MIAFHVKMTKAANACAYSRPKFLLIREVEFCTTKGVAHKLSHFDLEIFSPTTCYSKFTKTDHNKKRIRRQS